MRRAFVLAALMLTGCAEDPAAIAPTAVPSSKWAGSTCGEINAMLSRLQPTLRDITVAQTKQRNDDTAGLILFGITPTMLGGGRSWDEDIARIKGEIAALRSAGAAKGCKMPDPPPLPPPPKNAPVGRT